MTARKMLALFGDYLRPRVKMLRPKGYERPAEVKTDIRFQAWLRVVTHPKYPDYENDLMDCLVRCTGSVWQQERIAEFEMALSSSLLDELFVHREVESQHVTDQELRGAMLPVSTAAAWACVSVRSIHNWIGTGRVDWEKRGAYYLVTFTSLEVAAMKRRKPKKKAA